jgi:hypothetical protein
VGKRSIKSEVAGQKSKSQISDWNFAVGRKLKFKVIIFLVSPNPEPVIGTVPFPGNGSVTATDFNGINAAFPPEA